MRIKVDLISVHKWVDNLSNRWADWSTLFGYVVVDNKCNQSDIGYRWATTCICDMRSNWTTMDRYCFLPNFHTRYLDWFLCVSRNTRLTSKVIRHRYFLINYSYFIYCCIEWSLHIWVFSTFGVESSIFTYILPLFLSLSHLRVAYFNAVALFLPVLWVFNTWSISMGCGKWCRDCCTNGMDYWKCTHWSTWQS